MATLGEAFIAVKADLSPFRRDLKAQVKQAAEEMEKGLSDAVSKGLKAGASSGGKEAADDVAEKMSSGIKKKFSMMGSGNPWLTIIGAFGAALDNGLSALPVQLKATIVLSLLAIAPLIAGAIAGAVAAGLGVGMAGLGVALATQFTSVQSRWNDFVNNIRHQLVSAALPFERIVLTVIGRIEERLGDFMPMLENIFRGASNFVIPIAEGVLDALGDVLSAIETEIPNLEDFVRELAAGFRTLGIAVGDALQVLVATGKDGRNALRDIIYLIAGMIISVSQLIALFTALYGAMRDVFTEVPTWAYALTPAFLVMDLFIGESDKMAEQNRKTSESNIDFADTMSGVVDMTKKQEKALSELSKIMQEFIEDQFNAVDAQIAFEGAVDELTESFRENGRTIDVETKEGRNNLSAFGNALKAAQRANEERVASGKAGAEESRQQMLKEIEEIYKIAEAFGISRDRVNEYYGSVQAALLAEPPNLAWARELAYLMTLSAQAAERYVKTEIWKLPNRIGGPQPFAEGGIVYGPTNALIGEAGAEAVIPLTKPARAAQLLQQSGLDKMLFGGNSIAVQVFVGNEQLDARTVKIVHQGMARQAQALNFGVRT